MIFPETLYTKNVTNELSFPLVTHLTHFDIWFGRYGIFKLGSSSNRFWTDWVYIQVLDPVFGSQDE
jgi:hypothetical protein